MTTTDTRFDNISARLTINGFRFENVGGSPDVVWFGADADGTFAVIGTPGDWQICDAATAMTETETTYSTVEDAIAAAVEMNG